MAFVVLWEPEWSPQSQPYNKTSLTIRDPHQYYLTEILVYVQYILFVEWSYQSPDYGQKPIKKILKVLGFVIKGQKITIIREIWIPNLVGAVYYC